MLEPLPDTQTQTQTQGNSQWELMENQCDVLPQKVTWGQLFTKSIIINDHGSKFVVISTPQQFSEWSDNGCKGCPVIPVVIFSCFRHNGGELGCRSHGDVGFCVQEPAPSPVDVGAHLKGSL